MTLYEIAKLIHILGTVLLFGTGMGTAFFLGLLFRQWRTGLWQRWALFVASAAVAAEWLTTFSPLPLNLALCQYRTTAVIQISALTGIWGVSFLLWLFNAALADVVLGRNWPRTRDSGKAHHRVRDGTACHLG